jgi:hypothetical protein
MELKINKTQKTVTLVMPLISRPSGSKKNTLIATTGGNVVVGEFDGAMVTAGVNIYVPLKA